MTTAALYALAKARLDVTNTPMPTPAQFDAALYPAIVELLTSNAAVKSEMQRSAVGWAHVEQEGESPLALTNWGWVQGVSAVIDGEEVDLGPASGDTMPRLRRDPFNEPTDEFPLYIESTVSGKRVITGLPAPAIGSLKVRMLAMPAVSASLVIPDTVAWTVLESALRKLGLTMQDGLRFQGQAMEATTLKTNE